jgi:hypothetical protein
MSGSAILVASLAAVGCDDKSGSDASAESAKPQAAEQSKPAGPLIPVVQMADWCPEHGVPESVCTRCNASLTPAFKAKGDWDDGHNLPKSQCFECDPGLREKFALAYKEKYGKDVPAAAEGAKH